MKRIIITTVVAFVAVNSFAQYYGYTQQDVENMAARMGIDYQALTNQVYQSIYDNMQRQQAARQEAVEQLNRIVMPRLLEQAEQQMQAEYNFYKSFFPNATMSDYINAKNMAAYELSQGEKPDYDFFSSSSSSSSSYDYRQSYQRWENQVKSVIESSTVGGYTDSDGGHVNLNHMPKDGYVRYAQLMNNAQAEMKSIRAAASRAGISITKSRYEDVDLDCYK